MRNVAVSRLKERFLEELAAYLQKQWGSEKTIADRFSVRADEFVTPA